ncbi:translation initiation factor IF-2 [candidate division MSBL1 archaeon SCGC-AAA261G05]|uniref:Probable translation initiation factor IF-2 n=3 Tax=candidate division MSBL1 TaxID=215777 RepID=A0A133V290_9EURY|nr:translation initiation factor IF-2 [candidate division MSBL1 archaeon SCGC-AAA261C02]KXB04026.1 translation initiation factor IF-2 [candidate division MSBL1 archaeon SCGC-AAA261G05]KXB04695.1 translation initiation factor IF-2 [candidate division MSBL1 archaeon SCGC-AAA261O19]
MPEQKVRQPIISVLGHVDHGKTLLLDKIRGTTVMDREAGAITQHIGATEVPTKTVEDICGKLLERFSTGVELPGLLFVDTPGHEAFTNLRRRGGTLADLAILVVDVTEGFKPQTIESIGHLKRNKTPFVLAANKMDLLPGWNPTNDACFIDTFPNQNDRVQEELDEKIYEIVGDLHDHGFQAERFDRIEDFKKQVGIVPTSAKTGEGIPELLAVLTGLAQRFLKKELSVEVKGPGRGVVLEIKKERGLGKTADVIIYDGTLKKKDEIAIGGLEEAITTKVRALLQPKPLDEIRDPQDKFRHVNEVTAAAGVKIAAPDIEGIIAGAPVWIIETTEEARELQRQVRKEIESLRIQADVNGVVVKADTIGSLEALEGQLIEQEIPIRRADIGDVSRRDVIEASAVSDDDPLLAVILAFNVEILSHAQEEAKRRNIKIVSDDVIYRLIEDYQEWVEEERERIRVEKLREFIRPGKFAIKQGYVFRRSNPAIVGVDVLGGVLKPGFPVMNTDGEQVGTIREIQKERKTLQEAKTGDELALSIEGPIVDRHIKEGDVLYVDVPRDQMIELKRDLKDMLSEDELGVMSEIIDIKQKEDPTYGVM